MNPINEINKSNNRIKACKEQIKDLEEAIRTEEYYVFGLNTLCWLWVTYTQDTSGEWKQSAPMTFAEAKADIESQIKDYQYEIHKHDENCVRYTLISAFEKQGRVFASIRKTHLLVEGSGNE